MKQTNENTLDHAILVLLERAPESWAEYASVVKTELDEQALSLLTAAGMVERRCGFRLRMFNHPVALEATFTATGEYGLAEALTGVAASMWEHWGQAWQSRKEGPAKDAPAFHCERIGQEQWRLTVAGVKARDTVGSHGATMLDYVLKRGDFDGQRRQTPSGRLVHREPVRGKGSLEKMELVKADAPAPPGVNIVNWADGAKAFADAFAAMQAAMQAKPASAKPGETRPEPGDKASKQAKALAVLADHPDWTDQRIAEAAGCDRASLYRMAKYRKARDLLKGGKGELMKDATWEDHEKDDS